MYYLNNESIRIQNMTVAYQAEPVIWNIGVSFKAGKLTAIIGPNGAGKSTLLNATVDLIDPISGQVEYLVNQEWVPFSSAQKQIAYVPQKTNVDWDFPTTVLDVVVMGRYVHLGWFKRPKKIDYEIAKDKLAEVGMSAFENRQISQLSGGQRQRVFLARALAQEAEIYLLDEPFAGVDIKTEKVIIDLLRDLTAANKTVVVVHHDLQTVEEYFDEVVFLNHEIIAAGPTETVFDTKNIEETYRRDRNAKVVEEI